MTDQPTPQKFATPRAAITWLKNNAVEPLRWEIDILKTIPDAKDRLATLQARKLPHTINALPTQAEQEVYIDLVAKAVGISVKAVEDLLDSCIDLYKEMSEKYGGTAGIKKADPLELSETIYRWFANNESGRFFKTTDGKQWLFWHGKIYEIDNKLEFNTLMYRLTKLPAVEKPGSTVWYFLKVICNERGEPIDLVSWLFTDREKDHIYLNLNSPHNKILRITAGEEPKVIDNGTNEHSVLLSSSPQIRHFEFQPTTSEAEGFQALKTLMMDTIPCSKPQKYFHICWLITVFLMDYQGDRGIQQVIGTSGLGKSKVAERASQLVYGENYVGRGTGAGDVRIATHNPLNFVDNLENRDLNQGRLDFLLLLANSATKPKAKAGSDTEVVYQRLKSMGMVTSIEPFPGKYPELINRTFPLILDIKLRQHGYMHDEVMRGILKERNLILSAVFKLIARAVLPKLGDRTDWSKFIHTKYPGHNKERMNEHLCMMLLVLEGLLEFIPLSKDTDEPIKKQAEVILEHWISEFEEQATQTAITSNTLLTLMDGLVKEVQIKVRGISVETMPWMEFEKHFGKGELVRVYSDPEYLEDFYITQPKEEDDEEDLLADYYRVEFILPAADLYTIFNRFCANQHIRNPFENPTALGARISNDRAILEKADWVITYPYKTIKGQSHWRFAKKIRVR